MTFCTSPPPGSFSQGRALVHKNVRCSTFGGIELCGSLASSSSVSCFSFPFFFRGFYRVHFSVHGHTCALSLVPVPASASASVPVPDGVRLCLFLFVWLCLHLLPISVSCGCAYTYCLSSCGLVLYAKCTTCPFSCSWACLCTDAPAPMPVLGPACALIDACPCAFSVGLPAHLFVVFVRALVWAAFFFFFL